MATVLSSPAPHRGISFDIVFRLLPCLTAYSSGMPQWSRSIETLSDRSLIEWQRWLNTSSGDYASTTALQR